jgi:hypothetical protein
MTKSKKIAKDIFENSGQVVAYNPPDKKFNLDRAIDDLVGAIADPIIVWPGGGWEDTIPQWLKDQVSLDRLLEQMKSARGGEPTATDSEALVYMYPLVLDHPIDYDWTQIYLYLGTQVFASCGKEIPGDISVNKLNTDQQRDLDRLKRWIYETRKKHRVELRREGKRQQKEAAEKEQPAVIQHSFDLG